jgi:hypothetical protein
MAEYNKLPNTAPKDSVTTRLESLLGRLEKAHHRLSNVVDRILGPSPRPADNDVQQDSGCLRRGIDRGHELVGALESELDRLGDGL